MLFAYLVTFEISFLGVVVFISGNLIAFLLPNWTFDRMQKNLETEKECFQRIKVLEELFSSIDLEFKKNIPKGWTEEEIGLAETRHILKISNEKADEKKELDQKYKEYYKARMAYKWGKRKFFFPIILGILIIISSFFT